MKTLNRICLFVGMRPVISMIVFTVLVSSIIFFAFQTSQNDYTEIPFILASFILLIYAIICVHSSYLVEQQNIMADLNKQKGESYDDSTTTN